MLAAKREVLERMLASELEALAARLRRLGAASLRFRDVGPGAVRVALVETIAALEVYRPMPTPRASVRRTGRGSPRQSLPVAPPTWLDLTPSSCSRGARPRRDGLARGRGSCRRCCASRFLPQQLTGRRWPRVSRTQRFTAIFRCSR